MTGFGCVFLAVGLIAAPMAAFAQPARDGNIYDGKDHQPTAAVQSREQSAGVAPSQPLQQAENRDLSTLNRQLLDQAHRDARMAPNVGDNVYGVLPGAVVTTAPNGGGSRGR